MQQVQSVFKLVFKNEKYLIPTNFPFLNNINWDIYTILITNKKYYIKSEVNKEVFQYFVDYLVYQTVPNIEAADFFDYYQLSEEFDIMQNVLKLFQKYPKNIENSSIMSKNDLHQKRIIYLKNQLQQITKDYYQIIQILFNNTGIDNYSKFLDVKRDLLINCYNNDIKKVDILTRKTVVQNGFLFSINEQDKTACIIYLLNPIPIVFVPRSIEYKEQEFIVTEIYENAFKCIQNIDTIEFPEDSEICKFHSKAFNQSSIKRIRIPKNITRIENKTFSNCKLLKKIEFSEKSTKLKIEKLAFNKTGSLESIFFPSCAKLEEGWCEFLYKLTDIKIYVNQNAKTNICLLDGELILGKSDSKSDIFDVILFAQRKIESARIPSFIKKIDSYAFFGCGNLLYVEHSNQSQLKIIGDYAFQYCDNLEYFWFPKEVEIIGKYAFYLCRYFEMVEFEKNSKLKIIGESSFADTKIEKVSIPSSVIKIKDNAFRLCLRLKKVELPANSQLRFIGKLAFWRTSIETFSIPSTVIHIGSKAFADSDYFESLKISDDSELSFIGSQIFSDSNVKSFVVPKSVEMIDEFGFARCDELKRIKFLENSKLKSFQNFTFFNSAIESISIPPQITEIGSGVFYKCFNLQIIEIPPGSRLQLIDLISFGDESPVILMIPPSLSRIINHNYVGRNIESELMEFE